MDNSLDMSKEYNNREENFNNEENSLRARLNDPFAKLPK